MSGSVKSVSEKNAKKYARYYRNKGLNVTIKKLKAPKKRCKYTLYIYKK